MIHAGELPVMLGSQIKEGLRSVLTNKYSENHTEEIFALWEKYGGNNLPLVVKWI